MEGLARDFGVDDEPLELLCECGDPACTERISMGGDAYRDLRADSTRFAVVPGHELPEVETVVAHAEGYDVVEKHPGEPARIAEQTDRSRGS